MDCLPPPLYIDLIGKTFGSLYVFEKAESDSKGCARFLARCSCGDERRYNSKDLRGGKCVCKICKEKENLERRNKERDDALQKRAEEKREKFDISGLKVNDWTVLRPVVEGNFGCYYVCECICGSTFNFPKMPLIKGKVAQSCKKCVLKKNDEIKREKLNKAIILNKEVCGQCDKERSIEMFDKFLLKKGLFACVDCKKAHRERFETKNFNKNTKEAFLECNSCGAYLAVENFSKFQLNSKIPICRVCQSANNKTGRDEFLKKNLLREFIECFSCGLSLPNSEYFESSLGFKNPKCKKCAILSARSYEKDRALVDPVFKERLMISNRITKSLQNKGFKKDGTAAVYLGTDKKGYIKHIESLFRPGMSWDNRDEWNVDHVIPLSQANTKEDIKTLWHYTNLQPLWIRENEQKSDHLLWREMFDWAKEVVELRKSKGLE